MGEWAKAPFGSNASDCAVICLFDCSLLCSSDNVTVFQEINEKGTRMGKKNIIALNEIGLALTLHLQFFL